ncbi:pectinesterase-like [Salvia hispanica]|uniref:pectinesterase-like n=1 Tax=Salvia hispanica TaxID=49212 RepID=UPI002009B301|nr:pectinesterase-like [Salvia hispanica]
MDFKRIRISITIPRLTKTRTKTVITALLSLAISAFVLSIFLHFSHLHRPPTPNTPLSAACSATLYPSLCLSSLSPFPNSSHHLLPLSLHLSLSRALLLPKAPSPPARDCADLLDQTVYELESALAELPASRPPYQNIRTLLSAAMTNQHTCIDGFSDVENGRFLESLLTPVSQMISNALALIRHVEAQESVKNVKMVTGEAATGLARRRRKRRRRLRANVVVDCGGRGRFSLIGEAIAAAPNMSVKTYVIKIKKGVYRENVVIPREKINIMLVGEGMNSTIITASRSLADGFSTFESATLTVVGDKFIARDITIQNTAAAEKHQAVALRVTSNAAFYRCNIASHQDTLYAHSLRQLYHECTIQGTIDFIFGNAAAVFSKCRILVRRPLPGQRNTITAQGREDPNQNTGISLHKCTIEAAAEFNSTERKRFATYLGRPWRKYSRVFVANSYLGDLIHPRGWLEWPLYSDADTVEYVECRNYGPGASMRRRISWGGYRNNCTAEMAKRFAVLEFLHGEDDWLESTVIPIFD